MKTLSSAVANDLEVMYEKKLIEDIVAEFLGAAVVWQNRAQVAIARSAPEFQTNSRIQNIEYNIMGSISVTNSIPQSLFSILD